MWIGWIGRHDLLNLYIRLTDTGEKIISELDADVKRGVKKGAKKVAKGVAKGGLKEDVKGVKEDVS